MSLALNTKHLSSFINEEEYKAIYPQVEAAHKTLEAKNGPGSDFLGWMCAFGIWSIRWARNKARAW